MAALNDDIPLPQQLRLWVAGVLNGEIKRPARRGKHPQANRVRDFVIVLDVNLYRLRNNISPLRNDAAKDRKSACDHVAEARGMSYDAVAQIWKRRAMFSGKS